MPFDLQPTLRGALLELRPLRADDLPALAAAAADPGIWEQHPVRDRHRPRVFREFFREQLASGGGLLVRDVQTEATVGSSRFHAYDGERSEIEIGWTFLVRSHWGRLYNRELKELMLRHAFRFVRTVVFVVDAENLRSRRAVEKLGAELTGSRGDANGRASVVYRIDASSFDPLGSAAG